MKRYIVTPNDDFLTYHVGERQAKLASQEIHKLVHSERLLLGGSYSEVMQYFEEELPKLREEMERLTRFNHVTVDVGYTMTSLLAAYYAVLQSSRVTVYLHTPPAFGGETRYAKTHSHVIQKLIYNILLKAARVILPTDDALDTILEVYPRIDKSDIAWEVEAFPLPDNCMPIYQYVRNGIAVFGTFEKSEDGGMHNAVEAIARAARVCPELQKMRITLMGTGDHEHASNIAVAFPAWNVSLAAPFEKYVEAACQAEVVVLPDYPPHAGPTRELFAAIGAGAGIVAHERSAAGDYAGSGVVNFSTDGNYALALANALLRAVTDQSRTFALMGATTERRESLRSAKPTLYRPPSLDSSLTEGRTCQGNAAR